MFKKKILIIDDTEFMTKLISDVLVNEGYEVVSASNGRQGIEMVRVEKPDLVLLDVVMPDMDGFEVCKILRDDEGNNLMPIIMLTAQDNEDDKLTGLELGADDYIIKPFNSRELASRVRNTLRRIDRNRWANPLTGLQGNIEIQTEINQRIATKQLFAVIYADLDNFKAYNDVYGFASGDRAIKLTADIIVDNVHNYGNQGDFIGHVGGDDFIIVSTPNKAEIIVKGIIDDFDMKTKALYCEEDVKRGYIVTSNRQGQVMKFPLISISFAIVTNEVRELISHIQISEIAAELKKKAKSMPGSSYVKDRRKF
ncbi:GGDEF domain-containing response regulator [Acetivibrio mesophilus]|uniref:Stage 0 sporulation protein A homolog n=1 Tax=Acetivibrio mesophilus TaxID=2487273 RepID=A0A4Q0I6J3_9FIRM|nr:response regulator [Acetivibrio mesophilus]ODM26593.1 diguanylate cyclase response regulator [Clostridium sp. Bc-iso-3]RXE58582.1 response regulator [Acetivibrio mesophilus]HHV29763.1 response regulator [Clostridium sp.]